MNKTIYALGFFDGVHVGHAALLDRCKTLAREENYRAGVVTFAAHPDTLVLGTTPPLINTPYDREKLLRERFSMEQVVTLPFDEQMHTMPWRDFLHMLIRDYAAAGFVCGEDFRFGYRGEGNADALEAFCRANGIVMQHVKPHGAMYNMAEKDDKLAEAICRGVKAVNPDLILLGPGSGKMVKAAKALGLKTAGEVFADRAYMEDGTLVLRSQEGAMITDEEEAVARVLEMVQKGTVTAITGKKIEVQADSICVHGDGQKALLFVQKIRSELEKAGVVIVPMKEVIVGES